jgi:hypothetical protein
LHNKDNSLNTNYFSMAMKYSVKLLSLLPPLLLIGCGTFQLGSSTPLRGQSSSQMQADILFCKDSATLATNTTERQVANFLLELTIIGAPLAYELNKKNMREAYKTCMEDKGYFVVPPPDEQQDNVKPTNLNAGQPQNLTPKPESSKSTPAANSAVPLPASQPPNTTKTLDPVVTPRPNAAVSSPQSSQSDSVKKLEDLNGMLKKGFITQKDYDMKKQEILKAM